MAKQKFKKGDHVMIAKDLGVCMSHFTSDAEAIVIGSYRDQFGAGSKHDYSLYIKGQGECSWYDEHQLTLIAKKQGGLLKQWKLEAKVKRKREKDLKWIFENGPAVVKTASGASLSALCKCVGVTNMWGTGGEGITYYMNATAIIELATPFLLKNDLDGWLSFCKTYER